MKKIKISLFIILLAVITVTGFGAGPAAAEEYYGGAQFFSDEKGNFYICINNENNCRLFLCSRNSDISEINCQGFAAEDVYFINGNIFLSRYMDHTLCLFDVLHQDVILLECSGVKQDLITEADNKLYLCDEENTAQVKVYKGSRLLSTINTGETVAGLFSDPIESSVYAAVNDGIFEINSGRKIKCSVPAFPIAYNDGIYTDSAGNMYSFEKEKGFLLVFSTESRCACFCNGCAYSEKNGVIVRTVIESGKTAFYDPKKEIISLSASGSTAAVLTEDEVIFLCDDLFASETDISDESSEKESSAAEKTESSYTSEKQKDPKKPEKEVPVTSVPETTENHEVTYVFEGGFVKNIPNGTTAAAFRKAMNNVSIRFRSSSGTIADKGTIGTGWKIELTDGGVTKYYTAVIYGDINGNGIINTADADIVSKYLCDLCELTEAQNSAADMNRDGEVDIRDICRFQEIYYSNGKSVPENAFM